MPTTDALDTPKRPRGRPPTSRPVEAPLAAPPDDPLAALDLLEAIGRETADTAARELEAFRARLRTAYQEVPAAITQIRALETLYLPELRRLATLPWPEYRARLGSETLVGSLQRKVDGLVALFVGKSDASGTVASVPDQLARLGPQIERLGVDERTRADEILADCRRAPEWPAVVVKQMFEIRDLYQRLVEALRRRGITAAGVSAPGAGRDVTIATGAPVPEPPPGPRVLSNFNPTEV